MAKKVIKLTEQEFSSLIKDCTNEVLNEIGYRGAALPHGANYNAMMSKLQNGDKNALSHPIYTQFSIDCSFLSA